MVFHTIIYPFFIFVNMYVFHKYLQKFQKKWHITGSYLLRRRQAARPTKNPSRAAPFVGFFSGTFWPAAMLRIALWAGQNIANGRNVVRELQFLNNFRLKRQNDSHFAGLVRQPTGLSNKSNTFKNALKLPREPVGRFPGSNPSGTNQKENLPFARAFSYVIKKASFKTAGRFRRRGRKISKRI
jgi:hypothetical protein